MHIWREFRIVFAVTRRRSPLLLEICLATQKLVVLSSKLVLEIIDLVSTFIVRSRRIT
jgi:hypothetical protein